MKAEKYVKAHVLFNPFLFGFKKCSDYEEFSFIDNENALFRIEHYSDGIFILHLIDWHKETINLDVYLYEWVYGVDDFHSAGYALAMKLSDFYIGAESIEATEVFNRYRLNRT